MIELSLIVPGIRPQNWQSLYDSIDKAFSRTWEIIFISPPNIELPESLLKYDNIKILHDWGSPVRCQQMALPHCEGKWITWTVDDGWFFPNGLDLCFQYIDQFIDPMKQVLMYKFNEGKNHNPDTTNTAYYFLNYHDGSRIDYLPAHYKTFLAGIMHRDLLFDTGGWDCRFEAPPMSYIDMGIRLQNRGVEIVMPEEVVAWNTLMPGTSGDHAPIHYAQLTHDEPLYREIYATPKECYARYELDINNWRQAPSVWRRRFPDVQI